MLKKYIYVASNDTRRIITGCLKNTSVVSVYLLAGKEPPSTRRLIATDLEKHKLTDDPRHPAIYGQTATTFRLKWSKSSLKASRAFEIESFQNRTNR